MFMRLMIANAERSMHYWDVEKPLPQMDHNRSKRQRESNAYVIDSKGYGGVAQVVRAWDS